MAIPQFARLGPLFKSSKKAVELCLSKLGVKCELQVNSKAKSGKVIDIL